MPELPSTNLTRRAWLGSVARYATLAGLLGTIGTLIARGQCSRGQGACSGCPKLSGCDLVPAHDFRRQTPRTPQSEGRS